MKNHKILDPSIEFKVGQMSFEKKCEKFYSSFANKGGTNDIKVSRFNFLQDIAEKYQPSIFIKNICVSFQGELGVVTFILCIYSFS